ncbi:MAG TPA: hypothetical protein P5277_01485 [Candidatus Paceibacterota bacterium]|nr:hypothetical protein [Candidatus Paceibacterota bacterium]
MNSRKYIIGVEHDVGNEGDIIQLLKIVSAPNDLVGIELVECLVHVFKNFRVPIVKSNNYLNKILTDLDVNDTTHNYWMNLMRQSEIEGLNLDFVGIDNSELINKISKDISRVVNKDENSVDNKTRDRIIRGYLIDRENYFVKRILETNPNILVVGDFHVDFLKNKFQEYEIMGRTIRKNNHLPESWMNRYKELRYNIENK